MFRCPHSVFFFRGKDKNFKYFFIDDYNGEKWGDDFIASPNPLLVSDNEGKYFRAAEDFRTNANFKFFGEFTGNSFATGVTYYEKHVGAGEWYTPTTDVTMNPNKTYYVLKRKMIKTGSYIQVMNQNTRANPVYKFEVFQGQVANTLIDWGIVPLGMPIMAPPQQKLHVIDVPGSDGVLDLSNSLTGYPVFGNRSGNMQFAILHEETQTAQAYTKMLNFLQGTDVKMILEDDPNYYYTGRVYVENIDAKSDGAHSEVTLGYDLEPYKQSIYSSFDDWLWDPFNFELDSIDQSIFMDLEIDCPITKVPYSIDGGGVRYIPDPSLNWDDEHTYEIDFSSYVGQKPCFPEMVVTCLVSLVPGTQGYEQADDEGSIYAQIWNSDLYGDKWVGSGVDYAEELKREIQQGLISWSNSVDVFKMDDKVKGNASAGTLGINTDGKAAKYGNKYRKLVFCEFTPESVIKMRFKGVGRISIYFRKGSL